MDVIAGKVDLPATSAAGADDGTASLEYFPGHREYQFDPTELPLAWEKIQKQVNGSMNGSVELTNADLRSPDPVGPASAAGPGSPSSPSSPSSPDSLSPQLVRTTSMPGLDLRTRSSVIETELPNFFTVFWLFTVRALVEHTRSPSEFLYEMILQLLSGTVVGAIYRNFAFQQMPTMNFMMALSVR